MPTKKIMTNCEAEKIAQVANSLNGGRLLIGCPYADGVGGTCVGGPAHRVFLTKGNKEGYLYFTPCEEHLRRFYGRESLQPWIEVSWEEVLEHM